MWSRAVNFTFIPGTKPFRYASYSSRSARVPGQTPKMSSRNRPSTYNEHVILLGNENILYNICVYTGHVRSLDVNTITGIIFLLAVIKISFNDDLSAFRDLIAVSNTRQACIDRVFSCKEFHRNRYVTRKRR